MILKEKREKTRQAKKGKLYAAIALWIIILTAVVVSYTPLMQIYSINWIISIIYKNIMNLLMLSGFLVCVYLIERKKYLENLEKGIKINGKKHRR